jgi:hypothetical protein
MSAFRGKADILEEVQWLVASQVISHGLGRPFQSGPVPLERVNNVHN